MKIFDSAYDFYRLPRRLRKHMIDQTFIVKEDIHWKEKTLYFPIGLTKDGQWRNYGVREGVLGVTPVWPLRYTPHNPKKESSPTFWMKVYAFSPDDLDLGLHFYDPPEGLRDRIIAYLREVDKREVEYDEILEILREEFGGEIGD